VRRVFADTYDWIAFLNEKDEGHAAALATCARLEAATIVTTQDVLSEVLTHFCRYGAGVRRVTAAFVRNILDDPTIEVRPQSAANFLAGPDLYEARPDKGYSLTDCISMATMRREGIAEVLTHDVHFAQEGFAVLL
jgi:predicted nucleic acid-binding protein